MPFSTPPQPYQHWMLAEIFEQPVSLNATIDRYVDASGFREPAVAAARAWLQGQTELCIVASGSSRHAGLVGQAAIEASSTLVVGVEFASEYGMRDIRAPHAGGVIVISQSGETADTLAALRLAKERALPTLAITNVSESTMASEADLSMPVEAGRERAIPATKSFTGQLVVLEILRLLAGVETGAFSADDLHAQIQNLLALPTNIQKQLAGWRELAEQTAAEFQDAQSILFLGRGIHYPIASEGALKLKESAYLHAEGYPAGELKHGPNALVSEDTPLGVIASVDRADPASLLRYEKTLTLLKDMRTQGARVIVLGNRDDEAARDLATAFVPIEETTESLMPICEVIPLQMLAYYFAVARGIDVDRPRNLTKSVVIE